MAAVVKHIWKSMMSNIFIYIAIVIVGVVIYKEMIPYLQFDYLKKDSVIKETNPNDADIMDGYIPYSDKEKNEFYEKGLENLKKSLIVVFHKSDDEADEIVKYIRESDMTPKEIQDYLKKEYNYDNAEGMFSANGAKMSTLEDANMYISDKMKNNTYSHYFAYKYADYMAVEMTFFCVILFAISFFQESKKDVYQLLHTKPINPMSYVCGKVMGNFLVVLFAEFAVTIFMQILVFNHASKTGLPYHFMDLWYAVFIMLVPFDLLIATVFMFFSIAFNNSIIGIPIVILHLVYSNMGQIGDNGLFGYSIRPFSLIIRFADMFLENNFSINIYMNQLLIMILVVALNIISIIVWRRKRI